MRWAALVLVLVAFAASAQAKFAATQGFSGKHGVDCGACHSDLPAPLSRQTEVILEGLPAAWDIGASYTLRIRVEGGPDAFAPGQPRAGFDLETDDGRLSEGESMAGLLRFPTPHEATYTGAGTLRREWSVVWTAPDLSAPRPVQFWLAGLAANGNHIMGGPDAAGERGDAHAKIQRAVPPSEAAKLAWDARPVPTPTLAPLPSEIRAGATGIVVSGRVGEGAEGAQWRIHEDWATAIGDASFFFTLPPLEAGQHVLEVRAFVGNRTSEPLRHVLRVVPDATAPFASDADDAAPTWAIGIAGGGLVAALLLPLYSRFWRSTK